MTNSYVKVFFFNFLFSFNILWHLSVTSQFWFIMFSFLIIYIFIPRDNHSMKCKNMHLKSIFKCYMVWNSESNEKASQIYFDICFLILKKIILPSQFFFLRDKLHFFLIPWWYNCNLISCFISFKYFFLYPVTVNW